MRSSVIILSKGSSGCWMDFRSDHVEQYIKHLWQNKKGKSVSGEKPQSEMIFKVTIIGSVVARS